MQAPRLWGFLWLAAVIALLPLYAVAQTAVLSPTSLTFAGQEVGTTSANRNVTLSNTGNATLTITSISTTGDFATPSNTCGGAVLPGKRCVIAVNFTPTALGTRTGLLTVTDNASPNSQTVTLMGTGEPPVLVSPTSISFPSQVIHTTSAAKTVTVTNFQNTTLNFSSISASGDFSASGCTASLPPGGRCIISVTFTPTVLGLRTGTLSISDDGPGSPQSVSLSGRGIALALMSITVTPANSSIPLGRNQQFTATGNYNDGSHQNLTATVTWSSSKTSVATIAAGGLATSVAQGSTTITATSGKIAGSTMLTVSAPALVSIAVTPANADINSGNTEQFTATGTYTDGSQANITASVSWSSSYTAVATINSAGLATGAGGGTASIAAQDPMTAIQGSAPLNVMPAATMNDHLQGVFYFNLYGTNGLAGTAPFLLGSLTADGAGNITSGVFDRNDGVSATSGTLTGNYAIGSDHRGIVNLTFSTGGNVRLALDAAGLNLGYLSEVDGNGTTWGVYRQTSAPKFDLTFISGGVAIQAGAANVGIIGQFNSDGAGNITGGSVDANVGGAISANQVVNHGTYIVADSTRARYTTTLSTSLPPPYDSIPLVIYVRKVDDGEAISLNPAAPLHFTVHAQLNGPYSASSVSGSSVLTAGSASIAQAGRVTADGVSALTDAVWDFNGNGSPPSADVPFTGTFEVTNGASGRGTITQSGAGNDNWTFYLRDSSTKMFLLDTSSASATLGLFEIQSAIPFSVASLSGSYVFQYQGCRLNGSSSCTTPFTRSGVFTADGNGNITAGSEDINDNGVVITQPFTGTYLVGSGGLNPDEGEFVINGDSTVHFFFRNGANDTSLFYVIDMDPTHSAIGQGNLILK